MTEKIRATFQPEGRKAEVSPGEKILKAAQRIGIDISSICGGKGNCGKCKIIVRRGWQHLDPPTTAERRFLSKDEIVEHYRLACSLTVRESVVIEVPARSRTGSQRLQTEGIEVPVKAEPLVRKHLVQVKPPTLKDQRSDLERLLQALKEQHGLEDIAIEIETIRELPHALRERGWILTATLWNEERLTSLEPGDTRSKCYGLAVDIGTTKMAAFLVDLNTGQIMSTQSMMNPQILYGEDIISRITHATKGLRTLKELQRAVVRGINQMLKDGCRDAGVKTRDVHMVTIVGNTAMHHLFLGIYPGYVALAPYPPVLGKGVDVEASKLRLRTHPRANIYVLPTIGGFVGADNVGLILATRILESEEMTLALDIGTNTEIVLGNKEEARVCSCASGPAFEGAHIQHGMRATTGAIERIAVEPETLAVYYKTIDNAKPVGICGSALVDAPAEMLKAGVINPSGAFVKDLEHPRIRRREGYEFVIAWKEETNTESDIIVTQRDIRELQKAKAAMHAGATTLMNSMDLREEDIDRVLVAGAFGSYLDPENARTIGMYPEIPLGKVKVVGNAAGTGAKMTLISKRERSKAEEIPEKVRYYELAADPGFEKEFIDSLLFPHRDLDKYPVAADLLRRLGRLTD